MHPASRQISSGANRTLTYDANGNLSNDGNGRTFAYDAANRMVSCTQTVNGVQTVTGFVYDGYDRLTQETSNGTLVKQWVWCPEKSHPCEERDASGNVTKRFYGQGEQIGGVNYYFTRDHLWSVREITDPSGAIRARYDYDPFGRTTKLQGDLDADFRYDGFYFDQATGLYFSGTRVYSPDLARWLTRDTIGEAGGINLYAYCLNNPITFIDPYGLDARFTFNNGKAPITVTNARDFVLAAQQAAHGSITSITFPYAHGNSTEQGIAESNTTGEQLTYKNENVYVESEDGSVEQELGPLLKDKMAPNAYIWYSSCDTADNNPYNISWKTSTVVPNTEVTGSTWRAWFNGDHFYWGEITYENGLIVDQNSFSWNRKSK